MNIKVSEIPPQGRRYSGSEDSSIIGLGHEKDMHIESPISYDLFAQMAPGELIVRGSLSVTALFLCSRCGETFNLTVKEPSFATVREVGRDQSVDLTEEMREAIILAFPNYPVCKPGCRGLCSVCGISLNREKCNCSAKQKNKWAALDGLKLE